MNCEQARELAALAASGDVTAAEQSALELHVGGCAECRAELDAFDDLRAELAGMRTESAPEQSYAAVRGRVAEEIINKRKPVWFTAWPAFVAVVACSVMVVVLLHPAGPDAIPQKTPQKKETSVAIPDAARDLAAVAPVESRRSARRPVRRVAPEEPDQPVVVHLFTDDPNVVIYWIADAKGARTEKESMQ